MARPRPSSDTGQPAQSSALQQVMIALMVLVVAAVAALAASPKLLVVTGLRASNAPSTIPASLFAPPPPSDAPQQTAVGSGVVGTAPGLAAKGALNGATVSARVNEVPKTSIQTTGGVVIDPATGTVLANSGGTQLLIPASNLKTLTVLALLDAVGPDQRFTTTVVSAAPGTIILVGGGDPYLASAPSTTYPSPPTTLELASRTASALKKQGVASVTLTYDDSLFSGPEWHPSWPGGYIDQVTPITALMVDGGHPKNQPRSQQPAGDAARTFAAQLTAAGVKVTTVGGRAKAPASATTVASIESLPVAALVQNAMLHSDNTATEMLFRQVALASGQPGSFEGGEAAVKQRLTALGIWQQGAVVTDGCGLSRDNRVSAMMLGQAWRLAATTPRLMAMLQGLPVSGVSGTLATRFNQPETDQGRGWVHAKTGTLTHVSALSGWLITKDEHVMVFAFIVNNTDQGNDWMARKWLDLVTTRLSQCGCTK